jgi:hypothetical protein
MSDLLKHRAEVFAGSPVVDACGRSSPTSPISYARREHPEWVELTRSPPRWGVTAICAQRPLITVSEFPVFAGSCRSPVGRARELTTLTIGRYRPRRLFSRSQRPRSRQVPDRRSARTRWPRNAPPSPPTSRPCGSLAPNFVLLSARTLCRRRPGKVTALPEIATGRLEQRPCERGSDRHDRVSAYVEVSL